MAEPEPSPDEVKKLFGNLSAGGQQSEYDADGNPLPNAAQIASGNAYDPNLPPPRPGNENPHPKPKVDPFNPKAVLETPYYKWAIEQKKLQDNQAAKQKWVETHANERKPQAAAPAQSSAPATPFQSSGIDLTKQGKGESYIDSILSHYQETGVPQVGNESKRTLESFRGSQPANMDPYYDHASDLASAKIDNAMAARGSYGSSNATGQIGAAEVALRAQQARDNASYGLSRFAQEGSLAGAADQQGNIGNGIQYQWTKGLGDMASKSQELGEGRNQSLWNNNFSLAAAKAGIYGAGAQGAIGDVTAATDASINAEQGVASDALSNANANANASNSATAGLLNAANQGASNYLKYNSGKTN